VAVTQSVEFDRGLKAMGFVCLFVFDSGSYEELSVLCVTRNMYHATIHRQAAAFFMVVGRID
jgi:hypothetical protein